MYNLDLKCTTKKNIPNCSIHLQSENPLDPRLTLSWPRTQLNTISEVRVVVFCFLFQQRSSSWIFLGDVFGWQRMCLLLVCIKKKQTKKPLNNYACIIFPHSLLQNPWNSLPLCGTQLYFTAPVLLQNEVSSLKTPVVKIRTCPCGKFWLSASHQGVPGPGQYDIRRQSEPHDSWCSFLSRAEECKCTAPSFCHLQPIRSANLGRYDCLFPSVCMCENAVSRARQRIRKDLLPRWEPQHTLRLHHIQTYDFWDIVCDA